MISALPTDWVAQVKACTCVACIGLVAAWAASPARIDSPRRQEFNVTSHEMTVLRMLARGLSNKEIAREMVTAESTVKNRLSTLYSKLGVADRIQAVLLALDLGIVSR